MKQLFLALVALAGFCFRLHAADDNVVIPSHVETYVLQAREGNLSSVKHSETITYLATRADDNAAACTFYNDNISVDKASAPGAKPVYRQWIPDDIFYTDSRICFMSVPLKKGKPAKVVFERTLKDPAQFCEISLGSLYDTEEHTVIVMVPGALANKIKVTPYRLPAGADFTRREMRDGSLEYEARVAGMKALRSEPKAPSASIDAPALLITGYFDGLEGLYAYFRGFLETGEPSAEVASLAAKLTEGVPGDLAKIDTIAGWVRRNIRYVAVEHGEYGLRADSASAVLRKRFGDCKGLANLIKAMMRSVGIDGRMAWVGTAGSVPHDWAEVVSLASGNHAIAAAVLPDTIVYLDGTAKYAVGSYCPPPIQGRPVLVEDGENVIYGRIPREAPDTDLESVKAVYTLADGALRGKVEREYGGFMSMGVLDAYASAKPAKRNGVLVQLMCDGMKNAVADSVVFESRVSPRPVAVVSADITAPGSVQNAGGSVYVDLRPFRDVMSPVSLKDRRRGIGTSWPLRRRVELSLLVPEGMIAAVPPSKTFDNEWFSGSLSYEYDSETGVVRCTGMLDFSGKGCELERVAEYNACAAELRDASASRVVLKSK